jgi:sec-independent protein translocase protein TatC
MADTKPQQIEDKSKPEPEDELAGSEAPLIEHLTELRKRLIHSSIAIVVLLVICFLFAGQIFDILLNPYRATYSDPGEMELIYTAPQEFFFTQLNLAFFGAVFLGFPYLATQIYGFVAPGLYKHERKALVPYLVATPVFFLLGAAMVYFVVLPMALGFFAGMQTEEIKLLAKVSEYLGLAMTLILAFGICFQLPVVLTLLAQIDLINVEQLKKGRRYAIVGIIAAAAFITPPDPISQIGLALPMYGLYELAILSVRMVEKRRKAALAAEEADKA